MASKAADTFSVRLRIGGLCMFVPDAAAGAVHVFLPTTDGMVLDGRMRDAAHRHDTSATAMPRHRFLIAYPSAALGRESAGGATGNRCHELRDCVVRVGRPDDRLGDVCIAPGEVVALTPALGYPGVDPRCRDDAKFGGRAIARIELRRGVVAGFGKDDPCLVVPPVNGAPASTRRRMAGVVVWEIDGFHGSVDLASLLHVEGAPAPALPTLYPTLDPLSGRMHVDVQLVHVSERAVTGDCRFDEHYDPQTGHFAAYWNLVVPGAKGTCVWLPVEDGCPAFRSPSYVCMTAQSSFA